MSTTDSAAALSAFRLRPRGVPAVSEREASRFFLLAHMLNHLMCIEQYDVHGKVFYDLTGSHGQVQ